MASVLTKLSLKSYWAMRKAMVKEVYDSEDKSIKCVAKIHKVNPTTLWNWCNQDLGPNQLKWLLEKSHKIRNAHISKKSVISQKKEMKDIKGPTKIAAPKNKPWDLKKKRIAEEQAALPGALKALGISEDTPTFRDVVHPPTVNPKDLCDTPQDPTLQPKVVSPLSLHGNRKQTGATIVINLDDQGKFLKYEVTGDASVQVFTRNK